MSYSRLASMTPAQLDQFIQRTSQLSTISERDYQMLTEARQLQDALKQVAKFEEKEISCTLEALQTKAYSLVGDLQKFDNSATLEERFNLVDGLVAIAKGDRNTSQLELHIKQMESDIASEKQKAKLTKQSSSIHKSLCMLKKLEAEEEPDQKIEKEKEQQHALFSEEDQAQRNELIKHIKKCVIKLNKMDTDECKAAKKPIVIKHRPVNHLHLENLFALNKYYQQLKLEYDVKTEKERPRNSGGAFFTRKQIKTNRADQRTGETVHALFPAHRIAGTTVADFYLPGPEPTPAVRITAAKK